MLKKTCISACILAFFFVFSCISKTANDEGANYETYETFDLFFTFTYPKTWSIFEHESKVDFSNDVVLLTNPENERFLTSQSFFGSIYLLDSLSVQIIYTGIIKHALFLRLSRDGAFAEQEQKRQISIQELQKLSDIITGDEYTIVQNSYARIFNVPLSNYARGYIVGATVLIVDSFLEKNAFSENSDSFLAKSQEVVVIRTASMRKIEDTIFAISSSVYHTGIIASTSTEDQLLIMDSKKQPQIFLQDIVNAVQSIQINAPSPDRE